MKKWRYIIWTFIFHGVVIQGLWGQVTQVEFGKNRLQYHDDFKDWWVYESDHFLIYWYGKARYVAQTAMQMAELDYHEIVNVIEHRTNQKMEIIAYVDLTDIKQSNIGSEEQFSQTAGKTKIVGNKIFVYFNGDHQHLREQIRKGMASIILDAMLYGGNLQEVLQNAVFLSVPEWYREGLISYIADYWTPELEHRLGNIFQDHRGIGFDDLAYKYPEVIGHSFWYFLADRYGRSTIANLLYLTRINRNLDNAFLYVIGTPLQQIKEDWLTYCTEKVFPGEQNLEIPLDLLIRKERVMTELEHNPINGDVAYVTHQIGKARIYVKRGKKLKCIFKTGYCNRVQLDDLNYPLIRWAPDGRTLHVIYEKRDVIYYRVYDLAAFDFVEQSLPNDIQRIYDFAVDPKGQLYFTGSNNGLSDVFQYLPKSRQYKKLTDDFYDDLEVEYYQSGDMEGLFITSGRPEPLLLAQQRPDTILPLGNRNIYYFPLNESTERLRAITNAVLGDKRRMQLGLDGRLYFLSAKSGFWNRRSINLSEVFQQIKLGGSIEYGFDGRPETHYHRNISFYYQDDDQGSNIYDVIDQEGTYVRFYTDAVGKESEETEVFSGQDTAAHAAQREYSTYELHYFDVPFDNPTFKTEPDLASITLPKDNIVHSRYAHDRVGGSIQKFLFSRAVASRIKFRVDYFNTNLDNSLLFGGLDTYAGTKQEFETPPLGILLKANLKDIFEDYVIEGGTRITTSFNGSEFFLSLLDKKKRIDKQYALYRRTVKNLINEGSYEGYRGRNITFIGLFQARYPFDVYRSLRGSLTFRNDKYNVLAVNNPTLNAPALDEQRLGLKMEYVFDNTLQRYVNILNGSRYKIYAEAVKRMQLDFSPLTLNFGEGFMTVLGADYRYYLPVLKHSVLALRAHGATSFGTEKILFFAGGMENWLFPTFNHSSFFPTEDQYAYQTIATNIRGFDYNIRSGGTYTIVSTEFRLPLTRYLTKRKLRFAPLQHLQLSAFYDLGMAWFGVNPLSSDNPANSSQFANPAVSVDVQYYRDPLIMGYGWGIRTMIFGYYLKFDYAYGIETRKVKRPHWYLSLGMDF